MNILEIKTYYEKHLNSYFKDKGSYEKIIYQAMDYSLNVGGKRIRPILLMSCFQMYEKDIKKSLSLAYAIEMIHTYSLIHDDLPAMDNDDLRRGKPTNHKVYGESLAILAGDGLLNEAFNIMFDYCIENPNAIMACSVISHNSSCEGMIGGQVVDILSENKEIDKDELEFMHKKKTGALIKAAILSGAYLGCAPKEDIEKLSLFGDKLGLIFQIVDDILDVEGDSNLLGKNTNCDITNNKRNFITFYGLDKCKEISEKLNTECIDILKSLNRDTSNLIELTNMLIRRKH
ncbi:MAG: polyprenyl synthetase family protein [Clostridiaceae bacterium]